MCTASNYITDNHYFGRNFDYEISYNERVTITPRNFKFEFRKTNPIETHYAIIGIAAGIDGYPLYYDACNEKGLAIAGLNFAGNAAYREVEENMVNITPFELIPYLLSKAASVSEARELLAEINLVNINFADELPLSPLHWMMSDNNGEAIVIEPLADGLKVYDNPVGVLTNNPPFDKQLFYLNNYRSLSIRILKTLLAVILIWMNTHVEWEQSDFQVICHQLQDLQRLHLPVQTHIQTVMRQVV